MPEQTTDAIQWALQQTVNYPDLDVVIQVTKNTSLELVDKVREYFNSNNINYVTFSYDDLLPYI